VPPLCPGFLPVFPGGPSWGLLPLFPGVVVLPEVGAEEVGVADDVGDEPLVVEDGDDEIGEEADEDGAADVGALVEGDEGDDVVVGELEEVGADDFGAAALKVVVDNKDRGPELISTAERERIITRDKISVFLLIVTLLLLLLLSLLLLSLLLSIPSSGPAIC
jgi:hypothetical protein